MGGWWIDSMNPVGSNSRTSSPRNGFAVFAGGARQSVAKLGVSKDSSLARPSSAAILRDASLIGHSPAEVIDEHETVVFSVSIQ
jgi:hypothetical protein